MKVAINWLISQDNVVTLAKMTSADHLAENLGAVGWTMDPADVERLRQHYSHQAQTSDTFSPQ